MYMYPQRYLIVVCVCFVIDVIIIMELKKI